jgi:hypothetical protein
LTLKVNNAKSFDQIKFAYFSSNQTNFHTCFINDIKTSAYLEHSNLL